MNYALIRVLGQLDFATKLYQDVTATEALKNYIRNASRMALNIHRRLYKLANHDG